MSSPLPRIGIPFRTIREEAEGPREAYDRYLRAVREAGGEPVELSLRYSIGRLAEIARTLDGFLLPGSPADVDPAWYHAPRGEHCRPSDAHREQADFTLLDAALLDRKPVLAICYGVQSLNVYLGGTLIQDIVSEVPNALRHDWRDRATTSEPYHDARLAPGSCLAQLTGSTEARVNSSHHQAILRTGRELRAVACAPDGIIEAVESTEAGQWLVGVQWHPERMAGDPLAASLFQGLVAAARRVAA